MIADSSSISKMAITTSLVSAYLLADIVEIVIDYFGRSTKLYDMVALGQYEDCLPWAKFVRYGMLVKACENNYIDIVISTMPQTVTVYSYGLSVACKKDHREIVKFLEANGATHERCANCAHRRSR